MFGMPLPDMLRRPLRAMQAWIQSTAATINACKQLAAKRMARGVNEIDETEEDEEEIAQEEPEERPELVARETEQERQMSFLLGQSRARQQPKTTANKQVRKPPPCKKKRKTKERIQRQKTTRQIKRAATTATNVGRIKPREKHTPGRFVIIFMKEGMGKMRRAKSGDHVWNAQRVEREGGGSGAKTARWKEDEVQTVQVGSAFSMRT
jgi:hypothetical protein